MASTKDILDHHMRSIDEGDLKGVLSDYAPGAVMFTPQGLDQGIECLKTSPYNYETIQWTWRHFDPSYKALWVPKEIPTLILAGAQDLATPIKLFKEKKAYRRSNILMREIEGAGHFPWIENPKAVACAFEDYLTSYRELGTGRRSR